MFNFKIYQNDFKLNGRTKYLTILNPFKKQVIETKIADKAHYVHIIDRSYSMVSHIKNLIENVKQTISVMGDDDLFSLIWFSGAGSYKTLIKGATKKDNLNALLDSIASALGCTCFSEPLAECNTLIDDLHLLCENFIITLFTDGEPCVPWTDEVSRIMTQVNKMKSKVLAINCVGYGNYYNKTLLTDIAKATKYGVLFHSTKVEDYLDIFKNTFKIVRDLTNEPIIINKTSSSATDILYLSNNTAILAAADADKLEVNADKNKNQIFIISDTPITDFIYNGDLVKTAALETAPHSTFEATFKNFIYAYIAKLFYQGRRETAIEYASTILRSKELTDSMLNAFTFDEVCKVQKVLDSYALNVSGRAAIENTCPSNYIPAANAFCVMDLVRLLQDGDCYYIPASDYKRIGLKTTDQQNLFVKDEEQELTSFESFAFNKSKLNLSVLFSIKGHVNIDKAEAKRVQLNEIVNTKMYRTHTLIKDGFLNMEKLNAVVDKDTYEKIVRLAPIKFIKENKRSKLGKAYKGIEVEFDLTEIPIINQLYNEHTKAEHAFNTMLKITAYMAYQKVLNFHIKRIEEVNEKAVKKTLKAFTPEQIEVLRAHGLDDSLTYKGVDNKKTEKENAKDYYYAKTLEMQFKGFSSLPDVEVILNKANTLHDDNIIWREIYILLKDDFIDNTKYATSNAIATADILRRKLKECKSILYSERCTIAASKIAKVLTGANAFLGSTPDGKGNYTFTNAGATLIIKFGSEQVFFE